MQRLDKAAGVAKELASIVEGEPDLRHGSFSNAMEEVTPGIHGATSCGASRRAARRAHKSHQGSLLTERLRVAVCRGEDIPRVP